MALSLEERLAQVNGVVIPSKLPEGQPPLKPRKSRPTIAMRDPMRTKTCPICGHCATGEHHLRAHFPVCVERNGNPTGARWDDKFVSKFGSRPRWVKWKNILGESTNANTLSDSSASQQTFRAQITNEQMSERQIRFHRRLDAVNGVVIPSKLPPGEVPARSNKETGEDRKCQCPICGGMFARRYHVQSHFASCVKSNGNPTGARWDDACKGTTSHTYALNAPVSQQPQNDPMQNLQPGNYEVPDTQFDDKSSVIRPPLLESYQHNPLQSVSALPNGFEPCDLDLDLIDPQLHSRPGRDP